MFLGYLAWLVALAAIILTTPIYYWWTIVAAAALAILTSVAFTKARSRKGKPVAFAYWFAPLLPSIMSAYVVALVIFGG